MRLVKQSNPILRNIADEVELEYRDKVKEYSNILQHFFYVERKQKILGCSLPQFGIPARMCLCKLDGEPVILVNPKVWLKLGIWPSQEGCESLGGKENQYIVARPLLGLVTWYTEDGDWKIKLFTYKSMRIIQHEVDHLNGVLIDKGVKV